jgi:hypothetical protein
MNQRADSRKKNLPPIVAKPLINQRRWLLSHTMRCSRAENRQNRIEKALKGVIARFPHSTSPSMPGRRPFDETAAWPEQNESERR